MSLRHAPRTLATSSSAPSTAGAAVQLRRAAAASAGAPGRPLQYKGGGDMAAGSAHAAAASGIKGSGGKLPHGDTIQKAFGRHDVSHVQAHVGGDAAQANEQLGAQAYASGDHVAFKGGPDLHTAAHEAAHVVQQKAGVSLKGGIGESGDKYEQHADQVADAVVQGKSAEPILDRMAGAGAGSGGARGVQRKKDPKAEDAGGDTGGKAGDKADAAERPKLPGPEFTRKGKNSTTLKCRLNGRGDKVVVEVEGKGGWATATKEQLEQIGLTEFAEQEVKIVDLSATALGKPEDLIKLSKGAKGLAAMSPEQRRANVVKAVSNGAGEWKGGRWQKDFKVPRFVLPGPPILGLPVNGFLQLGASIEGGLDIPNLDGKNIEINPQTLETKIKVGVSGAVKGWVGAGLEWGLPCAKIGGEARLTAEIGAKATIDLVVDVDGDGLVPKIRAATATGAVGAEGKLTGSANIFARIDVPGFDETITLIDVGTIDLFKASFKPAELKYDLTKPTQSPSWSIDPTNKDNYTFDTSALTPDTGVFGQLLAWVNKGKQAAKRIEALKEAKALDKITDAQRRELGIDVLSGVVTNGQARAFFDLYKSAGDSAARIDLLRAVARGHGQPLRSWQDHVTFIDTQYLGGEVMQYLGAGIIYDRADHHAMRLAFRDDAVKCPEHFDLEGDATIPADERPILLAARARQAEDDATASARAEDAEDRKLEAGRGASEVDRNDAAGNPITGIWDHENQRGSGAASDGKTTSHVLHDIDALGLPAEMLREAKVSLNGRFVATPRSLASPREWLLKAMGYEHLGFGDPVVKAVWRRKSEALAWLLGQGLRLVVGVAAADRTALGSNIRESGQQGIDIHEVFAILTEHAFAGGLSAELEATFGAAPKGWVGLPEHNIAGWFHGSSLRKALERTPIAPSSVTMEKLVMPGEVATELYDLTVGLAITKALIDPDRPSADPNGLVSEHGRKQTD